MTTNPLSDMFAQIATLQLTEIFDCGFICFRFENDESSFDYLEISLLVNCEWQLSKRQRFFSLSEKDRPADFDEHLVSVLGPVLGEPITSPDLPTLDEESELADHEARSETSRFATAVNKHLTKRDLRVQSYGLFGAGGLQVFFTKGYVLTALPTRPDGDFHWAIKNNTFETNLYCSGPACTLSPW